MEKTLLMQVKKRRLELGLKQQDMYMRAGLSRQQYQHIESKGNPRLNTLVLVALGLNSELMLIPKEKREAVMQLLLEPKDDPSQPALDNESLVENPWQGLLDD
ncbi:helix-turn-helix transcriptional regulator [Rhizobium hidalgonense]|uniref:Helix-turn-helix transcriptional regulator n=1 Tax=Rhizobium hidalgonense TaxID=1538159 RepID=A0AAJ2LQ59_9HYPH|nr:helix-turn-helix transcriptional regulator [Rhizobium hidalgonense]MDR9777693.1 helix-turn-helix transcriptional regulator [Rhizobium hidalgonense]